MREQNGDHAGALAMLDSVTPVDTQMMQRREEAALRLAERTGNLERARQAAERLFGLRLDADKQLELAGKMHRLGLTDMAETVLGRAQRQAGNKTATLLRLMTQYQSQNQTDLAVQLARQILRKGPILPSAATTRGGNNDGTENARSQAIGVLARSGNLKEMIERAEAQLKASPNSIQIHQALVGYYQAAGDKEKLKAALLKMAELKPEDGKLRYQVARDLQQAGERDAAIEQYKIAIKLDPSVIMWSSWELQNLFAQANKLEDLAKLFDEIDLRKLGNYWARCEPVGPRSCKTTRPRGAGLRSCSARHGKAFPAVPAIPCCGHLWDDSVWRLPEIYDVRPAGRDPAGRRRHRGLAGRPTQVMQYGGGRPHRRRRHADAVGRPASTSVCPELRAEVAAALALAARLGTAARRLLAVIDVQLGKTEQGIREWEAVLGDPHADIPPMARFMLTPGTGVLRRLRAGRRQDRWRTAIDDLLRDGKWNFQFNWARPAAGLVVRPAWPQGRRQDSCSASPTTRRATPAIGATTAST